MNESSNFTTPDVGGALDGQRGQPSGVVGNTNSGMIWDPSAYNPQTQSMGAWVPQTQQTAGNASSASRTFEAGAWGGQGNSVDGQGRVIQGTSGAALDANRYRGLGQQPQHASGPQIDTGRADQSRAIGMGSLGLLQGRASGDETPAQRLSQQQTQGAVNGVYSGAASIKGGAMARAAAQRGAVSAGARLQAQGNQDTQALRAREMADAAGQYMGASSAQRQTDLGLANSQASLEMGQRAANDQREGFYEGKSIETKNAELSHQLGRSASDANAANAATATSNAANAASQARTDKYISAGVGGITGGIEGYRASHQPKPDPNDVSDERAKTQIVPLYEDAGTGVERHWDRDVSQARPDVTSGASLSGPSPKYSRSVESAPRKASSKPATKPKERKMTLDELEKYGRELQGSVKTQSDAQIGAGSSLKQPKPTAAGRVRERAKAQMDPTNPYDDTERQIQADALPKMDPTNPYDAPPVAGYAARRAGQPGYMFGGAPAGPMTQHQREVMTSDPRAKQEAFELGVKQGVSLAGGDNAGTSGPRGKAGPSAGGKAASSTVAKAEKAEKAHPEPERPSWIEEKAQAIVQPDGTALPQAGIGPMTGIQAAQGIGAAVTAAEQGYQSVMAPRTPPVDARASIRSDERTKTKAHDGGPMADANRSMAPFSYAYKPGYAEEAGQRQGEKNVGPMAQNMAADPLAKTAIVERPDGMLAIDKDKGLKLVMGGLADLQGQLDAMKKKRTA
jgi:hypothetical protein